jgi:3-oxoacyl-[acyl-carrier-protein] synthase-3
MSPPTILDGISYRHGGWHGLDELVERNPAARPVVEALARGGLRRYSVIEKPVRKYYDDCVVETLERASVRPADVEAVVFVSSSFSAYDDQDDLVELARRLRMHRALPIGLFAAECSNFSYALMVAQALISARGMRCVLLLGADSLDETRASRLLPGGVSVFSDAVFSGVVSSELTRGFLVEHVENAVDPELSALDPRLDLLRYMDRFTAALRGVCGRARAATGREPSAYSGLVLANLATPVLKNYADLAGIPFTRVPTGNVARFGHCFGYDQMITLATLAEEGKVASGDVLQLIGVGATYLFSSTTVRCL